MVTVAVVGGAVVFSGVASATSIDVSVVGEEDIKDGEPYDLRVSGAADRACDPHLNVIETDDGEGFFNDDDRIESEVPLEFDGFDVGLTEFSQTVTLDSAEAWDEDGNQDDGAELRVELVYDNLLCSGTSTEVSTAPINPADPSDPDASKDVSISERSVETGESFGVNVIGTNEGGHAGEFNAIQVEFPGLDEQSDGEYVEDPTGSAGRKLRIEPGDELGSEAGGTVTAGYWQAELAFGPDELYRNEPVAANSGQLDVGVTAPPRDPDGDGVNNPYEMEIHTRVTLTDDTDQTEFFSAPGDDDATGDQGHGVEVHTVEVDGPDRCPDERGDGDDYRVGCDENPAPSVGLGGGGTITEGDRTTLTADGSDPEGKGVSYDWSLDGPGRLSESGGSATYVAPEPPAGITADTDVSVVVTATESDGEKTAQATETVAVSDINPAPTVDLADQGVTEGERVRLRAEANNPEDDGLEYSWSLDGAGSLSPAGGAATYAAPADVDGDTAVDVSVTVTEPQGKSATARATVGVRNEVIEPTADAGGPYSVGEGERLSLDSSGSTDPDGRITGRSWSVTGGPGSVTDGTYRPPADVDRDREVTVELTVTDDDGATDTDTASVTVRNEIVAPTAEVRTPDTAGTDQRVCFDASGSTDPDGAIRSYAWDFDGNGATDETTATPEACHTFGSAGSYEVSVTVTDDDGATDTDSATLTVEEADTGPPAVAASGDRPTDTDGDARYEDVNGDRTAASSDVQALFANLDTAAVQNNVAAFDFNGDGVVSSSDVQALFAQLTRS